MRCAQCDRPLRCADAAEQALVESSEMVWCSDACSETWNREHPEEAAKWTRVEDMTASQRAELDVLIGRYAGVA